VLPARIPSLGLVVIVASAVAGWFLGSVGAVTASPTPGLAAYAASARPDAKQLEAPASAETGATIASGPAIGELPLSWQPMRGRECIRSGRYKGVCQGPRRVPVPVGAAASEADALGLGGVRAVGRLIAYPPKPEWVQAAGTSRDESLLWPVERARLFRGLQPARPGKRRHKGLDIAAPEGAPIRATKSGIVAYSDNAIPGYGNLLVTVHPDGSVAFYGHCRAIYVFAGQRVQRGQIVGEVGKTGRATGPHVHFEYRTAGKIRNPLPQFGDQVPNRPRRRPNV
jgi:murein DD-endopeptidase MepM/ murein hydrolase activator NlpD